MGKLLLFNFISADGYVQGSNGDISWHVHGPEENQYAVRMLEAGSILLFGRVTYELMAGYWSTQTAARQEPAVAAGMNSAEKIVFSRTLRTAGWNNTRVLNRNIEEAVRRMKRTAGKDMALLGSGSIATRFAEEDLIDEYQFMVDPVILGDGTPLFGGIRRRLSLRLVTTRTFGSGVVLLCYRPGGKRRE